MLKIPPALVARGTSVLSIGSIRFEHGQRQVESDLACGTALSYLFHRDDYKASGLAYLFISTDTAQIKLATRPKEMGVLGVDFNADHLALSRTDRFGDLLAYWRFELPLKGKTFGQKTAVLSELASLISALYYDLATDKKV